MPLRYPLGGTLEAGIAQKAVLVATHASALELVSLEDLKAHALDD